MPGLDPGTLDKFITIQRPTAATGFTGAGSGPWARVDDVWANIQDVLPSRGMQSSEGFNTAARPARVRMYYREDVTADMRFVFGSRIMKIVSGPAEIGFRDGLEFMVEEFKPAGSTA